MEPEEIVKLMAEAFTPRIAVLDGRLCISLPIASRGDGEYHNCYVEGPAENGTYWLRSDHVIPDGETPSRRIEEFIVAMGATISGTMVESRIGASDLASGIARFLLMLRQVDNLVVVVQPRRNADELTRFWMRNGLHMRAARILAAAGLRTEEEVQAYGVDRLLQEHRTGIKTADELFRRFS